MYLALVAIGLTAVGMLAVACGDGASDTPTVLSSPTPSTATPTPAAEVVTSSPTATSAPGKAPGGCLSGELAYVDPDGRFAFCYPSDMEFFTGVRRGINDAGVAVHGLGAGGLYPVEGDASLLSVGLNWQIGQSSINGKPCTSGDFGIGEERIEPIVISGRTGLVCFQDRYHPDAPDVVWRINQRAEVPVDNGVYVVIDVTYAPALGRAGIPAEQLAARFLESVVVY